MNKGRMMAATVKFYGGEYDGLAMTFDPGPPPSQIMLQAGTIVPGDPPKKGVFIVQPERWREYILEYVDPETFSPLVGKDENGKIVAIPIYVPESLVTIEVVDEEDDQ